jgi:RimJ/RimL family protein N-acetyltransferase
LSKVLHPTSSCTQPAFFSSIHTLQTAVPHTGKMASPLAVPTAAPPILTLTRSLTIRPFRTSDAPSLAHHANNKEMWLNGLGIAPFPFTLSSAHSYIAHASDSRNWACSGASWTGPALPSMYAITSHDVCIGSIEFCPGEDIRVRTAKIGYWVSREYWGGS